MKYGRFKDDSCYPVTTDKLQGKTNASSYPAVSQINMAITHMIYMVNLYHIMIAFEYTLAFRTLYFLNISTYTEYSKKLKFDKVE